ncbi:MAG: hypothetical protein WC627_09885 [Legionella sp.]|jgi:hypothetical protein
MKAKTTTSPKPIRVTSFNFDGCLFNEKYHKTYADDVMAEGVYDKKNIKNRSIIKANAKLFGSIEKTQKNYDRTIIMNGSQRQSQADDKYYLKKNKTGSALIALQDIKLYFNPDTKEKAVGKSGSLQLDPYLLADSYAGWDPSYSFAKATTRKKVKHPDWKADPSCLTIVYAQIHKIAKENPHQEIVFDYYHNDNEILQNLHGFFAKNPKMMPANVKLQLHQYSGGPIQDLPAIIGTGSIDVEFKNTIKKMQSKLKSIRLYNTKIETSNLFEDIKKFVSLGLIEDKEIENLKHNFNNCKTVDDYLKFQFIAYRITSNELQNKAKLLPQVDLSKEKKLEKCRTTAQYKEFTEDLLKTNYVFKGKLLCLDKLNEVCKLFDNQDMARVYKKEQLGKLKKLNSDSALDQFIKTQDKKRKELTEITPKSDASVENNTKVPEKAAVAKQGKGFEQVIISDEFYQSRKTMEPKKIPIPAKAVDLKEALLEFKWKMHNLLDPKKEGALLLTESAPIATLSFSKTDSAAVTAHKLHGYLHHLSDELNKSPNPSREKIEAFRDKALNAVDEAHKILDKKGWKNRLQLLTSSISATSTTKIMKLLKDEIHTQVEAAAKNEGPEAKM